MPIRLIKWKVDTNSTNITTTRGLLSYAINVEQIVIESKVITPKSTDVNSSAALNGNEYHPKEYEELFTDTASGDTQPSYTYVRDAIDVADSVATRSGRTDFVIIGGWSGTFAFDDTWNYRHEWLSKANEFSVSPCNGNYHLCTCELVPCFASWCANRMPSSLRHYVLTPTPTL